MLIIEDNDSYNIMIDEETCEFYAAIKVPSGEEIERINDIFNNAKVLSAHLRDELGYLEAYRLLERNQVPKNSDLWDLNHDNPWK